MSKNTISASATGLPTRRLFLATTPAIPARTVDGLGVKMRVLAYDCGLSYCGLSDDEIEWPELCFRDLLQEVARSGITA